MQQNHAIQQNQKSGCAQRTPHAAANAHRVPITDGTPMPCRQKNARAFQAGDTPGVMDHYAPGMHPPTPAERAQPQRALSVWEDDETVEKLVRWRKQAIY